MRTRKGKKKKKHEKTHTHNNLFFGSDLGKGRKLPVPNIPGNGENRSTRMKKPISPDAVQTL